MLPKYEFKTEQGELVLQALDVVEPNNGRMLYIVSLTLEKTDVTKKYFMNWNYINYCLDNYNPISNDNKWIYIPNEGSHFLIRTYDLQKIVLPYIATFAVTFIENIFFKKYILIMSKEIVVIKNLENGKTQKIDTFSAEKTFKNYTKDEEKLNFTLNDGEVLTFELKELE